MSIDNRGSGVTILTRDVLGRPRIRRRYPGLADRAVDLYVLHLTDIANMVPGILELTNASKDLDDNHILACAVE